MNVAPGRRDDFLALMQEHYGASMSPEEFDWWFDGNPAGPRILNEARDDDGTPLGVLAMSGARMSQGLASFAVHAVTTPAARGRGVFSTLELHNEEEAARAGATWALGFTNPMAGPILVGKLGWEDVCSLRIWVRPKRLRKRGEGRLRVPAACPPFEPRHEVVVRRAPPRPRRRLPRLALRAVAPRVPPRGRRRRLGGRDACGLARVLVRGDLRRGRKRPARRCCVAAVGAVDADLAVAMVNPGEERSYLAAGFVPTPRQIRFIGKRLTEDAPELPKERKAWRFSLGDMDFF